MEKKGPPPLSLSVVKGGSDVMWGGGAAGVAKVSREVSEWDEWRE